MLPVIKKAAYWMNRPIKPIEAPLGDPAASKRNEKALSAIPSPPGVSGIAFITMARGFKIKCVMIGMLSFIRMALMMKLNTTRAWFNNEIKIHMKVNNHP